MQILTFNDNIMQQNCYAVELATHTVLVDCGFFSSSLQNYIQQKGSTVAYILLTHHHFDHTAAVAMVQKYCPNAKVVIHKADAAGLKDFDLNLANNFRIKQTAVLPDIVLSNENETLEIDGNTIRFMHTPGHTAGSVCYFLGDNMFSGDTLFYLSFGRTDFLSGNEGQMQASLHRLAALTKDYKVWPGHMQPTTLFFEKSNNTGML